MRNADAQRPLRVVLVRLRGAEKHRHAEPEIETTVPPNASTSLMAWARPAPTSSRRSSGSAGAETGRDKLDEHNADKPAFLYLSVAARPTASRRGNPGGRARALHARPQFL